MKSLSAIASLVLAWSVLPADAALRDIDITSFDTQWRYASERRFSLMIGNVNYDDALNYIPSLEGSLGDSILKMILTDSRELNAVSGPSTSDLWPGDEGKFPQSCQISLDDVHGGNVKLDESIVAYEDQIIIPIAESAGQLARGVSFGIDAERL